MTEQLWRRDGVGGVEESIVALSQNTQWPSNSPGLDMEACDSAWDFLDSEMNRFPKI